MTIWRAVDGTEHLYEVSDQGEVRRLRQAWVVGPDGVERQEFIEPRTIRGDLTKNGYRRVTMSVQGRRIRRPLVDIVGQAFLQPPPDGLHFVLADDKKRDDYSTANIAVGRR